MAPIASLSCKESFTISHVINSPHLSSTVNKRVYGICNTPVEHKHEFVVEVIIRGVVDNSIGTVTSLSDLKSHLRKTVVDKLNGKNLNTDIDYFKSKPTSMEQLTIYIWQKMREVMDTPEILYEVKLMDQEQNCAVYNGDFANDQKRIRNFLTSDTE